MEAMIVCMDLLLKSSSLESAKVITSSEGVRRAVRGMSEVQITCQKDQEKRAIDKTEPTHCEPTRLPRTQSVGREQSWQPASSWRTRLLQDQENEKNKKTEEVKIEIEKK